MSPYIYFRPDAFIGNSRHSFNEHVSPSMRFHIFRLDAFISQAEGTGPLWIACANEAIPQWGKHDLISHVYLQYSGHDEGDVQTLVLGVDLFLSQAVCFTVMTYGTSSFITSALDALVFVKVCNLWWVSSPPCNSCPGERQVLCLPPIHFQGSILRAGVALCAGMVAEWHSRLLE